MKRTIATTIAMLLAGTAHAQTAPTAPTTGALSPEKQAEEEALQDGAPANGDDIVVTAQRREERLQNVPISITALTSSQLSTAGIADTQSLAQVTPGFTLVRSSYSGQPAIRGISTRNAGPGDEPNVASYVDGVYQPEQFGTIQELANVERVEVLKGPQGTLYGRNATAGAVSVITKRPSFEWEGDIAASYGDFDYRKISGYVSGPVAPDVLAVSLAGFYLKDDGYIRNVFLNTTQGSQKRYALRGKALLQIAPGVNFQVNGLYSEGDENATFSGHSLNGNNQARRTANPAGIPLNILIPQGDFETSTQFVPYLRSRLRGIDGHFNADLGFADLGALASWSDARARIYADADVSPFAISFIKPQLLSRSTTQEITLTSKPGRFTWLLGANRFNSRSFQDPMNSNNVINYNGQFSDAYAVFAEATYEVLGRLFVTAGLRYSYDKKDASFRLATSPTATTGSDHWQDLAPRAVLRYEFGEDASVYASYSQGFKTGTFNTTSAAGATASAAPEEVQAYEIGAKWHIGPGINFTAAAFHYDYTNLQTTVTLTLPSGALFSSLQNAPAAKIDGLESTLAWRVAPGFQLSAGLSLLKAKVTEFPNATLSIPILVGGLPAGNTTAVYNVAGRDLIRAPRHTFNIGASYSTDLFGGKLSADMNAFFSAKWYNDLLNRVAQPAYEVVNATVTWRAANGVRFSVFGQNLTDARYFLSTVTSSVSDTFAYQKPRWFGGTIGYAF